MTLITWENTRGKKRRCDASCHNARKLECVCICKGHYHGAANTPGGLVEAVEEFKEEVMRSMPPGAASILHKTPTNEEQLTFYSCR